ncbi:hypothetical protein, partial [Enterococcus durans]|uniref:hypothetical protein n=1 Tax=Enterococcus durans TaxID=53345 RepID=UPI001CD3E176
RSNGFGLTAGRNDEILTRWNLEKILTNRVRGIDSNPFCPYLCILTGYFYRDLIDFFFSKSY